MEFDTGCRDDLGFGSTYLPENYLKPGLGDDGFTLDACSSKGYIQDFHQLDQFPVDGLLSNSKFGVPTPCFDQFEASGNGCPANFNLSEWKPFIEMEKFQNRGFLNCAQRIPAEAMEQDKIYPPLNFQELESSNMAFLPEGISCRTAENRYCRKINGMNRKSMTIRKTSKDQRKANVIKGQWTNEEDRLHKIFIYLS